uniref:Nucleolar protein 10 n=1 Tax=Strongyloides venezuelensis TaxID=75913 RepID=A0A0K0FLX8_STRVS
MYLKFYLDDEGRRVYTLKKHSPEGKLTLSAHPAKFSPEDKFSKYRILTKKRFGLLPCKALKESC